MTPFLPQDFGAFPNSKTVCTDALQRCIDACAKAGGGIVHLSRGLWLSGPLKLRSNVTLELSRKAILKADNSEGRFRRAFIGTPTQEGEAFITADGCQNVKLVGDGIIDGDGEQSWWPEAQRIRTDLRAGNLKEFHKRFPGIAPANGVPRPWMVEFNNVFQGEIKGLTFTNSPMWNLVVRGSAFVSIERVHVLSDIDSPNTNGAVIVSSSTVTISHSEILSGDDNITIKSGLNTVERSSSNIIIEKCLLREGHGISIGSETVNGIGKVMIRDCEFINTENGIRVKTARGRGYLVGPLEAQNLSMQNVATPILVTCSYAGQSGAEGLGLIEDLEAAPVDDSTPMISNLRFSNITANGAKIAAILSGLPESPVRDILFHHVRIQSELGVHARYVGGTHFVDTKVKCGKNPQIVRGPQTFIKETRI